MFLSLIISGVNSKFSTTPQITTEQLSASAENSKEEEKLLIVDARRLDEFQISHIPQAQHLWFRSTDKEIVDYLKRESESGKPLKVAAYCSVGYRSSILVDRINSLSNSDPELSNVSAQNVQGSIFKWFNEGRPIVDSKGHETKFLHPYNRFFGLAIGTSSWKWE